jgi:hypothetical protein
MGKLYYKFYELKGKCKENEELKIIFLGEIFIFKSGSSVARQRNTFWSSIGVSWPNKIKNL